MCEIMPFPLPCGHPAAHVAGCAICIENQLRLAGQLRGAAVELLAILRERGLRVTCFGRAEEFWRAAAELAKAAEETRAP